MVARAEQPRKPCHKGIREQTTYKITLLEHCLWTLLHCTQCAPITVGVIARPNDSGRWGRGGSDCKGWPTVTSPSRSPRDALEPSWNGDCFPGRHERTERATLLCSAAGNLALRRMFASHAAARHVQFARAFLNRGSDSLTCSFQRGIVVAGVSPNRRRVSRSRV